MVFGENPLSNNVEPEDNLEPDVLDDSPKQETAPVSEELFVREVPPEYQELIDKENKFIEIGERYSDNLAPRLKHNKELMSLMQQRIEGESVLDLGSGSSASMLSISKDWKAKRYIGVDLHRIAVEDTVGDTPTPAGPRAFQSRGIDWLPPKQSQNREDAELPLDDDDDGDIDYYPPPEPSVQTKSRIVSTSENQISIKGDMLDATSRLEDNSIGAVIISGIERNSDPGNRDKITFEYIEKLEQEIYRVLKANGLFIVYESDIGADENFKELFSEDKYSLCLSVSEKIEKEEN